MVLQLFGIVFLDHNKSAILDFPAGKKIVHGPKVQPYMLANARKIDKIILPETHYLKVTHLKAELNKWELVEIVSGPLTYEQNDAYARVEGPLPKIKLEKNQYLFATDGRTGEKRTVNGPTIFTPGPYETFTEVKTTRVLNPNQYVYVEHLDTGIIDVVEGPASIALGGFDKVSDVYEKIALMHYEYIKILDKKNGVIRVERGPKTIRMLPHEQVLQQKSPAHTVNEMTAVYIYNTDKGTYELITKTEDGIFIPSETQKVIESRTKYKLQESEAMVIIDKDGKYMFMKGSDETRAFFLPPYCSVYSQEWSTNIEGKGKEQITIFDLKPQHFFFDFLTRTCDNVVIKVALNFFWQIIDIEKMIRRTNDVLEDMCKYAISKILEATSVVTLDVFMENFNQIIQNTINNGAQFYEARGIIIHSIEITDRKCVDKDIEDKLHDIIKEKTNRLRNIEKAEGEKEVEMKSLQANLKLEQVKQEITKMQKAMAAELSSTEGITEAQRISTFLNSLPKELSKEEKLAIYFDQQNTKRMQDLSKSGMTVYLTPKDVDLRITNMNYAKYDPSMNPNV